MRPRQVSDFAGFLANVIQASIAADGDPQPFGDVEPVVLESSLAKMYESYLVSFGFLMKGDTVMIQGDKNYVVFETARNRLTAKVLASDMCVWESYREALRATGFGEMVAIFMDDTGQECACCHTEREVEPQEPQPCL
jgi:hypothetical protein